jgi:hypothetical protein
MVYDRIALVSGGNSWIGYCRPDRAARFRPPNIPHLNDVIRPRHLVGSPHLGQTKLYLAVPCPSPVKSFEC